MLGLCWDLEEDTLFFKLREFENEKTVWTKRKILSRIGKLYDPNGYLGPIIIRGKMIIQDLWKNQLDWDEKITGHIELEWEKFNDDLQMVQNIFINRWIGTQEGDRVQLHGFCDASEKGYGAVIYSRVRENAKYRTEIMISKSRVAPLKATTIPRLELCAAELLAKLMETVAPTFQEGKKRIQIYCWSDSQITLQWLQKPSSMLKTFVGNRVENVQSISRKLSIKWNWIIGRDNPADLISRGTTVTELQLEEKWWNGPVWLRDVEQDWPKQPSYFSKEMRQDEDAPEIQREIRTIHFVQSKDTGLIRGKWFKFDKRRQSEFPLINAYGDWKKLVRIMLTIIKACYKFKGKREEDAKCEKLAIDHLIRLDQRQTFPAELKAAKTNDRALLAKLVLIWDPEEEFLRIDGRVRSKNLSRDEQFPIILGKEGSLAKLLIRDAHLVAFENGHAGTQLMLQFLRRKFWIYGARLLAKKVVRECPICFRLRFKGSQQLMATLPTIRTSPKLTFVNVGIDYAGPVLIRSSLGRLPKLTKAWIAVFVCLVTRAIHLELVRDASTQAFIEALKRFIARRGRVEQIISDNATNFVGANGYLTKIFNQVNQGTEEWERMFKIKWTFTTPAAPHHGGIYEAAVKSIKYHLVRIIGETSLTYDEYDTILCQVEAFVNSRPISPLNDDPTTLNALTPGHFLVFEPLVCLPEEVDLRETPVNRLQRWEHVTKMLQHFWDRWHHEYLTTLTNRTKWLTKERDLRIGDMVIIKDDNIPPMKWKLGRIEEILPGKDTLVRSVIVRTAVGVYKRPIVKLGLLVAADTE